ncbi:DUF262 domain-containing protein [Candidatus Chloroploca sp. M-50]|uniref:DUF262 domain-containing protein n=1 Tax=Candidatus Chloroploca mongolica TaxID=2528176 RepID=A0ABS4DBA1_9CHLR|nr:DUF262 domain-containing protein [Candidatus Chloroploca mongolica]MBP1466721.1 DUF262 domain-containing protein [Candidatus Chloroploca mongolica]
MNKKTLTSLFAESLYQIPDYQRGYAWEEKQWKDFIQDIDALVDEEVRGHYTGTVVVYAARNATFQPYGIKHLRVVDVVDGQQRLTTVCLYLAVIIRALVDSGDSAYKDAISEFLYSGATCKLTLNNDTDHIFYDLLKTGQSNIPPQSPHQRRLVTACARFQGHIDRQLAARGAEGVAYLRDLYRAITQKLNFTFYEIDEVSEIGMTFELMNSRGKSLSTLELLKNYLMHWVSRNESEQAHRDTLTKIINTSWKAAYTNLGRSAGNEDQFLRIAWTLYCSANPKQWTGYDGFKDDQYIPLRSFTKRSKESTRDFIIRFTEGLAELSNHYAAIISPRTSNNVSGEELRWLTKIHHTGNIANFLPLLVAAHKCHVEQSISEGDYIALLKALECYAYRVFLHATRRSNAGRTIFFRWGHDLFNGKQSIDSLTRQIHGLTRHYAPEKAFLAGNAEPDYWYRTRHLLKYTLFEYELHLLKKDGHGMAPKITWSQLSDATIEHILPQSPAARSHWRKVWSAKEIEQCVHDIGNLVLTHDNSSYSNFEFDRKRGAIGVRPSYSDSDIRQERDLGFYKDWTPQEFQQRRATIVAWINERWKTEGAEVEPLLADVDEDDDDEIALQPEAVDV